MANDDTPRPGFDYLPIEALRLDPDNPRFVTNQDTTDLVTFLPWFHADADLLAVASSIASNGYHDAEPLLVAPRNDEDDRLVVVEGNRRFAAVLLLHNPDLMPRLTELQELSSEADLERLTTLPCVTYQDRNEILTYLGNRHVVGVKEWKPLAKARYVHQLRVRAQTLGEPDDDKTIAKRIGSNGPYVRRLLNSLLAFESVQVRQPKDEARFSVMQTALQYSRIADFVGIGARTPEGEAQIKREALQELADWTLIPVDETRPSSGPRVNTRRLEHLNEIVANSDALAAFRDGATVERAHRMTGSVGTALRDALNEVIEALANARTHAERLTAPPTASHRAAMSDINDNVGLLSKALEAAEHSARAADESAETSNP